MDIFSTDISQYPLGEDIVYNTLEEQLQNQRDLQSRVRVAPLQGYQFKEAEIPANLAFDQSVNFSSYDLVSSLMKDCYSNADMKKIEGGILNIGVDTLVEMISNERDTSLIDFFRNKQFLTCLRIILSSNKVSYDTTVHLNSLILQEHYMQAVPENDGLLKGLAQEVNRDVVSTVTSINSRTKTLHKMSPDSIIWMVANRYSAFDIDDRRNIERFNQSILFNNQDAKVFDVETMIELYCVLFDRLGSLFSHTWFDITGADNPAALEKMTTQCYAILEILETQSYDTIYIVLKNALDRYAREVPIQPTYIRMGFESIPANYVHIWSVMKSI